ncbi:MAG: metalloregulator ArsR/SmtB family transcription factor [Thaumarchaeota archaeon]|nr:metalloregulator ArsR/SmtB family transcription factor [Nitrososphaerota archaeon]
MLPKILNTPNAFSAVADPTRRAMLDLLCTKPRSAGEIVSRFPELTQPGVSQHLRVLREAQLVTVTINAQQRIYTLKPEGFRPLQEWISKYQEFWTDKLDALQEHLDASKKAKQMTVKKK